MEAPMINRKILASFALGILILIFALNGLLRMLAKGQTEVSSVGATVVVIVLTVLAAPVMVYNHFTHANEGPITLMQIVLLITSSVFWGFVLERITYVL